MAAKLRARVRAAVQAVMLPEPKRVRKEHTTLKKDRENLELKMQQAAAALVRNLTTGYDFGVSTRDNYQVKEGMPDYGEFTAPFDNIRASLDHRFHGHYSLERQAVQDALIKVYGCPNASTHPNLSLFPASLRSFFFKSSSDPHAWSVGARCR